jgi:methionyl-tRNA formyltransferase
MRLVFAGTPDFAGCALSALVEAGHEIVLVLTQPDRPAGRGLRLAPCPTKRRAQAAGIEVFQPATLRDLSAQERVRGARADALVVAAYGLLLPQEVLDVAPRGAINIHASLLPRWRGAAPVQRALLAGDVRTGITIMQMERGLDTGPMLLQRELPILPEDDSGSLSDRLAQLGARMIVEVLAADSPAPVPQPAQGVTYASKITRADALLDWNADAVQLERVVRAMRPAPGAQTTRGGEVLKVWRADCGEGTGTPGTVLAAGASGIVVACGTGALRLLEVQRAGGRRLSAAEFLRGTPIAPGELL